MSEGIRSGVNWMRLKLKPKRLGERGDQQRLGQPRHADEQRMPAAEQRDQQLLDHRLLPDDHLAELRLHVVIRFLQLLDRGQLVGAEIRRLRLDKADFRGFHSLSPVLTFSLWSPVAQPIVPTRGPSTTIIDRPSARKFHRARLQAERLCRSCRKYRPWSTRSSRT